MSITSKDGFKGNSDTATKLTTPRSINGTNFDGTANITTANWGASRTLTIGNTGKSVNGSGNVSWSLSEIGAAPTGYGLGSVCSDKSSQDCNNILTTGFYMGSNMTNKPSGCTQGWIYLLVMRHNDSWVRQVAYDFGTASQIYTRVKQNNTWSSWVATDNNTWRGVQDNLTSSATDQSLSANQGKVLKGLVDGKAASNHTHTSLKVADTRNANTAPSALDSVFSVDFKYRSTINNAPGTGTYNGLLQFAPWSDSSGGNGYQMSYGYSGTVPYLGIRTADLNSSSWGSWYEIYHTGRKPSKADVGLSNVQNWSATSATNDSSTSKYATAAGVKAAYDKGIEAINKANQAFQSASNGKNIIAQAITGKGISASGSETFDSLASKINNINTGKKWAKGQVKPLSNLIETPLYVNDVQLYLSCVEVSGLTFKPSIIIITGCLDVMFSLYYSESAYYPMKFWCDLVYDDMFSISIGSYTTYINNTGFRIPLFGTGDSSYSNNRLYDWIAIE